MDPPSASILITMVATLVVPVSDISTNRVFSAGSTVKVLPTPEVASEGVTVMICLY